MRPLLLVLFVTLTLFGLLAVSNVQRALAAPIVSLDASSASQLDAAPATSLTTGRTARVGVVVTGVSSTAPLSNVFGWQFTINYATAAVTAQADPALATDPLGTACTIDVDCSEASDATVKFGAQTLAGTVNWNGLIASSRAAPVIVLNEAGGKIQVALTLLAPETPKSITASTLLANVAFELDSRPVTDISFTLSDVIFVDQNVVPIPGITVGGAVTWTIGNTPPVASGTISNLSPTPGEMVTFDASGSTDAEEVAPAAFVWDFGADDDGDGLRDLDFNAVATHAYTVEGDFRVTLRVRDTPLATGSARDQLGDPIGPNGQPSHVSFLVTVIAAAGNNAPTVTVPGPQTVDELVALSFTVTATDPDAGQTVTLSATDLPAGAAFSAATGVFSWTPSEAQGPGSYTVSFTATDNGSPVMSDTKTVMITVNEVNVAPILAAIGNKNVDELTLLTFTVTAADADLPANTLTFSLDAGAPSGATITAAGVFTWTPTEAQGPGTFTVTIRVTDSLGGTDFETITITVAEVNVAPVLAAIGDKSVVEETLLTFTATATDADLPGQTLSFSLGPGAPAGASITSAGVFTWTPSADQGPGTYTVRIVVSDGQLEDFEDITIIVTEPTPGNNAPVLDAIGDKTVDEETALMFTVTASDVDGDTLSFSVTGAPSGASLDPNTGVFNWAPSEAQGPGAYMLTITVSDGSLSDSETITITVNEVNRAPSLNPIGDKTVDEMTLLSFTATASDPDLPANSLTFSLGPGAPTGAAITSAGQFAWTPSEARGPGTYPITIIVTDSGTPSLSDSETITVTVNEVNRPPEASFVFTFADTNGNGQLDTGETVSFDGSGSIDPDVPLDPVTSYSWDFGDTGTATGAMVTHIYTTGGTFTVTLTVTDSHGATGSTFQTLEVGAAVAHARLNRWKASPQFHHQDLNKNPTQTLFAHAVNDGDVTVYVYVQFTITSENGPSQTLTTQVVALMPGESINGRQDPRFAVTFTPEPGVYTVTATLYYSTTANLPIGDPSYIADTGSIKTFSFTAVRR